MPSNPLDSITGWEERARVIPHRVARILAEHRRTVARINAKQVDPDTRRSMLQLAQRDAQNALQPWQEEAKRAGESLRVLIEQGIRPRAADTATELRRNRAWERVRPTLERAESKLDGIEQAARQAKADGDTAALEAIWEMAPSVLEADGWDRRNGDPRVIISQLGASPADIEPVIARKPSVELGLGNVAGMLELADSEIRGEGPEAPWTAWQGYDKGEVIDIAEPTPEQRAEDNEAGLRSLMGSSANVAD